MSQLIHPAIPSGHKITFFPSTIQLEDATGKMLSGIPKSYDQGVLTTEFVITELLRLANLQPRRLFEFAFQFGNRGIRRGEVRSGHVPTDTVFWVDISAETPDEAIKLIRAIEWDECALLKPTTIGDQSLDPVLRVLLSPPLEITLAHNLDHIYGPLPLGIADIEPDFWHLADWRAKFQP